MSETTVHRPLHQLCTNVMRDAASKQAPQEHAVSNAAQCYRSSNCVRLWFGTLCRWVTRFCLHTEEGDAAPSPVT